MISGTFLMTIVLPLQLSLHSGSSARIKPFFMVGSFIDCAKILGLPKFKLRDSKGNPYIPDKALAQEPMAIIYANADIVISKLDVSQRKQFILSYINR